MVGIVNWLIEVAACYLEGLVGTRQCLAIDIRQSTFAMEMELDASI
jgi:hypothetical protein